jgi:hypothetical protein
MRKNRRDRAQTDFRRPEPVPQLTTTAASYPRLYGQKCSALSEHVLESLLKRDTGVYASAA